MPKTASIIYRGFEFEFGYSYWKGSPATYDQPAEPAEYDIFDITLNGIDAHDLLDQHIYDFEEEAINYLNNNYYV